MKYIRIQKVVKKICDDNVTDLETIQLILQTIKDKQLFCSFVAEINYNIIYCTKARILSLDGDYFHYRAFNNKATVKDRARFDELREVKVETEIEKTVDPGDKDNRWFLLDIEEE